MMHTMSMYVDKNDLIRALQEENERLRKALAGVTKLAEHYVANALCEPSEDPDIRRARAALQSSPAQGPTPNLQDTPRLRPGLYRVHWKSGGVSEAAIGCSANGDNWIAPTNWISTSMIHELERSPDEWGGVDRYERITGTARAALTDHQEEKDRG